MKTLTAISLMLGAAMSVSAQGTVVLENATLTQLQQNRIVEVSYELTGDTPVYVTLDITTNGVAIPAVTLWGDVTTVQNPDPIVPDIPAPVKKIHWNASQDWPSNLTTEARATVTAWFTNAPPERLKNYVVVDLSEGPEASVYPYRYSITPPNLADVTCKTTELWLRRIPAGTFTMGSPDEENGRFDTREHQREVTLTQDFYIGVFEVTQTQYELIMNTNPATAKGPARPVGAINYNMIRGSTLGAQWPQSDAVDETSFMGKLRKKTGNTFTFDLPTEVQWEYACRAGTTNALHSGRELTATGTGVCTNLNEVARNRSNTNVNIGGYTSGHTTVGSFKPNAWGLYDMLGNIYEWCLDRHIDDVRTLPTAIDPKGPTTGTGRIRRGGSYAGQDVAYCRSAYRSTSSSPGGAPSAEWGFRVAIQPPPPTP